MTVYSVGLVGTLTVMPSLAKGNAMNRKKHPNPGEWPGPPAQGQCNAYDDWGAWICILEEGHDIANLHEGDSGNTWSSPIVPTEKD